jgi:hypothetical protein
MRDYSKVSSAFWTGKTGKALRGNHQAQVVALYLMTCPHANMIGVFHCPIIYIAHETGSSIEGATKGLNELVEGAFCTYDHDSETVWVHEMARFQIGENLSPNDKQVVGIKKQFTTLPEGLIKQGFHARYKDDFILPNLVVETKPHVSPLKDPSKPEAGTEAEAVSGTEEGSEVISAEKSPAPKLQGKALPKDWKLPKAWGEWAVNERPDLSDDQIRKIADEFKDYWLSIANQAKAKRADWEATWRNWIRKQNVPSTGYKTKGERIAENNDKAFQEFLNESSEKTVEGEVVND